MVTRADVDQYQTVIDGLSTVAFSQVKALLLSLDDPNPIVFRDALVTTYPELMAPFVTTAGEVAAEWYNDLRVGANLTRTYIPTPAPAPPREQLDAAARYSIKSLFAPAAEFIGSDILSLLAGFTQKLIANQGRNTIELNSYADPVRVGWARIPQPGCCSFCALMASRGAVYSNAEAAGLFNTYHKFCRCVPAPAFPGADNGLLRDTQQHFEAQYSDLESADGSVRELGEGLTLQGVLADWRHTHGTK